MSPLPKSKTLKQQIDANAAEHGDRIWLASPETGRQVSFADGAAQIRDIAQHIANMGLPKCSSIAIASPNSISACLTFMGIVYGGYVALPLNLVAGAKVLGYTLAHSKAALIFVQSDCQDMIQEAMQEAKSTANTCPLDLNDGPQWLENSPATPKPNAPIDNPNADSIGVLMYTSGTTGNPKGVMLSHHNLLAAGHFISTGHGITKQDRALCVLPIYHINGLCVTVMGTTVSGSMLVLPHKFSVSSFWSHIAAYKCSWFSAVPTQFAYILNHPESTKDLSYLRFARSASAPLSPEIHRRFEERFNIPIIETMGLTETGSQITTNPLPPRNP
ncbi:AMP-binding protein [Paracoccaceae bacterium]|nr:AMP-binding protein [Paracoccaceae bacterium]